MSFGLSRRKLISRVVSVATTAAIATSAFARPYGIQADAPRPESDDAREGAQSTWLRNAINSLRSSVGASLVGFARPDAPKAAGTVQSKLLEFPSITDFGAVADGATDNTSSIQRAIDAVHGSGGGMLRVPAGTFRIAGPIRLRSNIALHGTGAASVLHCVNAGRTDAICVVGQPSARLSKVAISDLAVVGEARFENGKPRVINGSGLIFVHADDCRVTNVTVVGFSDNGIAFLNGSRNSVMNCHVEQTAQGISFTANDMPVDGNVAIGNRIVDTGEYNALHLEGGFGGKAAGEVRHTTLSGNIISGCWEAGINIELAPYTACVGNTVDRAGLGRTAIRMGIKVYGGYRSTVCGNTVIGGSGDGIVIGANSGECSVDGNVTAGNAGSLLLTDSGAQVSNDVAIGSNSFTEGDMRCTGNVRLRNRTLGLSFANRGSPDQQTLDWYEEGRFIPTQTSGDGNGHWVVRNASFTRIGNVVHIVIGIEGRGDGAGDEIAMDGLPYPAAVETPLFATIRSIDRVDPASGIGAAAHGRHLVVLPDRSHAGSRSSRPWHVAIAGQYLTGG